MNGFKIMLGAIGVQVLVMGLIQVLQGLNIFGGSQIGAQNALTIGAVMIVIGGALASWPYLTGLRRDLAGACSIFFFLFGVVWSLQGINQFPGESFMNGQIIWTYIGIAWIVIGIALFLYGRGGAKSA